MLHASAWIQTVCLQHPPVYTSMMSFLCGASLPEVPLLVPCREGLVCCSPSSLGAWTFCFFCATPPSSQTAAAILETYAAWVALSATRGSLCLISREDHSANHLFGWKHRLFSGIHCNLYSLHSQPTLDAMVLHPDAHLRIVALWAAEIAHPERIPSIADSVGGELTAFHLQQAVRTQGTPTLQQTLACASKRARRIRKASFRSLS